MSNYLKFNIGYTQIETIKSGIETVGHVFEATNDAILIESDSIESVTLVTYPKHFQAILRHQGCKDVAFKPLQVCIRTKTGAEHIVLTGFSTKTLPAYLTEQAGAQ